VNLRQIGLEGEFKIEWLRGEFKVDLFKRQALLGEKILFFL
jgi:hypothetical protein